MYTIISGTNRKGSNTIRIAEQCREMLAAKGIIASLITLVNLDVNRRNDEIRKLEEDYLIPSDKFIFISPEYNGSIPGVLKSLIDNSDIEKAWWYKKALLIGVSSGRAGNLRGMDHLTAILHYVKVVVHPNKLPISVVNKLIDKDGKLVDKATITALEMQLDEFIQF